MNDEQANASAIDEREDLIGQREEVNKRADLFGLGNEETNETEDLIGLDRKEFDETSKQGPSFNNDIFGTKDEHNYLFEELQASVDDDEIRHDDVLTDQCNEVATAPSMTAYQLGEQVTGDDSNNEGNNKLPSEVLNGGSTDKVGKCNHHIPSYFPPYYTVRQLVIGFSEAPGLFQPSIYLPQLWFA